MDEAFLGILRCPITKSAVAVADPNLVQVAIDLQSRGELRDRQGRELEPFDNGLVDSESTWFYAVRGPIPSLIPDQAVAVADLSSTNGETATHETPQDES